MGGVIYWLVGSYIGGWSHILAVLIICIGRWVESYIGGWSHILVSGVIYWWVGGAYRDQLLRMVSQ